MVSDKEFEVEETIKVTPETIKQKKAENKSQNQSKELSDLELLVKQVAYTLASEIQADRIAAKVEDYKIRKDRHGRDILVVILYTHTYGKIPVSYSPQFAKLLLERLKQLGISKINEFLGNCFEFERVRIQKVRADYTDPYPRFLPIRKIDCGFID